LILDPAHRAPFLPRTRTPFDRPGRQLGALISYRRQMRSTPAGSTSSSVGIRRTNCSPSAARDSRHQICRRSSRRTSCATSSPQSKIPDSPCDAWCVPLVCNQRPVDNQPAHGDRGHHPTRYRRSVAVGQIGGSARTGRRVRFSCLSRITRVDGHRSGPV
jgi:hypothetical protein